MQNILVIDDTEDLRSVIATVLKSYGFSVREAQNGRMGVQMIAEEKPDLVICDVNMPPDELIEAVMSRLVRQADVQLEADKRAQKLHEYAARHSFPELTGYVNDNVEPALA